MNDYIVCPGDLLGRRFPRVGLGVCPGISRLSTFLHKRYHLTARIYNGGGTPRRPVYNP
jgi:hypothetical protein